MHKTIIVLSVLISACSNPESDAKNAVLNRLSDPDSAKFGEFTLVNEHGACLGVNARNKMGGYTGEQQAILIRGDKDRGNAEWEVTDFSKLSHENCIDAVTGVDFSALGKVD